MSQVEAISFDEVQVGRKVAETKKRFKWRFKINNTTYNMELANSSLSGKRVVTLNSMEIYSQKDLFNIDFDYTHTIDGHILRITRIPDNLNKFEMRIDNRSFEDILNKKDWETQKVQKKINKNAYDPFSEFGNFVNNTKKVDPKVNNQFGQFDFDDFSAPPVKSTSSMISQPSVVKTEPINPFLIGGNKVPVSNNFQTINFQTNSFQTNNVGNFMENFKKVESNLLDQQNFATNTYGKNNLYNDLMNVKQGQKSDTWSQIQKTEEQSKEKGSFADNFKVEMSAKQVFNKMKQAAQELKMKVTGMNESLI